MKQHEIDIESLSLQTGIPVPTLQKIRKNETNPTVATLEPLSEFFRYDIDTLLYEEISNSEFQIKLSSGKLRYIPILSLIDSLQFPVKSKLTKFVGAAGINHDAVFGVEVIGKSMSPAFREGAIAVIDTILKPKEGDYVLCQLTDNEPLFRQIFMEGRKHFFRPINPSFGDIEFHDKFKIIGVVIKSIFEFR